MPITKCFFLKKYKINLVESRAEQTSVIEFVQQNKKEQVIFLRKCSFKYVHTTSSWGDLK